MYRWLRRSVGLVLATLLASVGSLVAFSPPAAATTASTGTVFYWNNVLLDAFRREGGPPTPLSRAAAIMHAAIFDVFNNAQWNRQGGAYEPYAFVGPWDPAIDDDLTAGIAARDLLIFALPAQRALFEQKFTERHGTASQPAAVTGAAQVVNTYRNLRSNDGSNASPTYTFDNVPGAWRLTGHLCPAPATPQWGRVTPFLVGPAQYQPPPLPGGYTTYAGLLASNLYATNFNEVKSLGRSNSTTRTAEQTRIAHFWANDLDGTYKPPGQLLEQTRIVAQARYSGTTAPLNTARLFALISMALADAGIAAWDLKYNTPIDLWRPETAIQLAGTDNNPATTADTSWRPLSKDTAGIPFSPCFPAWVSGHATFAGAWAGVMRGQFGDANTFTYTTDDPFALGVTRTFATFTAAATENARSRIYLGVHYQFDADDGLTTGLRIGDIVAEALPRPRDISDSRIA